MSGSVASGAGRRVVEVGGVPCVLCHPVFTREIGAWGGLSDGGCGTFKGFPRVQGWLDGSKARPGDATWTFEKSSWAGGRKPSAFQSAYRSPTTSVSTGEIRQPCGAPRIP